jgi:hypothetical protein
MIPRVFIVCHKEREDCFDRIKKFIISTCGDIDVTRVNHVFQHSGDLEKVRSRNAMIALMNMVNRDYFSLYAEIGEYMGHINAIKQFIESGEEECLIMDDMSTPRKNFIESWLKTRLSLPAMYSAISLSGSKTDNGDVYSTAYIIRKECAEKLIEHHYSVVEREQHYTSLPKIMTNLRRMGVNIITTNIALFVMEPHNYNIAYSEYRQKMIIEHKKQEYGQFHIQGCKIEIVSWGVQEGEKKSDCVYVV